MNKAQEMYQLSLVGREEAKKRELDHTISKITETAKTLGRTELNLTLLDFEFPLETTESLREMGFFVKKANMCVTISWNFENEEI